MVGTYLIDSIDSSTDIKTHWFGFIDIYFYDLFTMGSLFSLLTKIMINEAGNAACMCRTYWDDETPPQLTWAFCNWSIRSKLKLLWLISTRVRTVPRVVMDGNKYFESSRGELPPAPSCSEKKCSGSISHIIGAIYLTQAKINPKCNFIIEWWKVTPEKLLLGTVRIVGYGLRVC